MFRRIRPHQMPLPRMHPPAALAALLCACLLPAVAFAEGDPAPAPTPAAEAPAVQYAPVTEHDFDPEDVEGRTKNPDGDWVQGRAGTAPGSLIRIRTTFNPELLQSAQDI